MPDSRDGVLFADVWRLGAAPEPLGDGGPPDGVMWIDVDPHADPGALTKLLAPRCEGLHVLAIGYAPARKRLYRWHAEWEPGGHESRKADAETLPSLRHQVADFRTRLEALNQPGMAHDPERIWFAGRARYLRERGEVRERAVDQVVDALGAGQRRAATQAFAHHEAARPRQLGRLRRDGRADDRLGGAELPRDPVAAKARLAVPSRS